MYMKNASLPGVVRRISEIAFANVWEDLGWVEATQQEWIDAGGVDTGPVVDHVTADELEAALVAERLVQGATYATQASLTSGLAAKAATVDVPTLARRRNKVALLGDSITRQNSDLTSATSPFYGGDGYFTWANILLRQRLDIVTASATQGEFGAGGLTTAVLISGGHVASAAAADADWCIVHAGTNDVGAGVSAATIAANLLTIWNTLIATGKTVVATTILPRNNSDSAANVQILRDANRLIRANAAATRGVVLCDWYGALLDASTGLANLDYLSDGVHPDAVGASRMGKVLADVLSPLVPAREDLAQDNTDTKDLLSGSLFTGTGGAVGGAPASGSVATGWTVYAQGSPTSVVCSKVARSDLFAGEWQQVVITAVAQNTDGCSIEAQNTAAGTDFVAGDTVYGTVEFETDAATWNGRMILLQVVAFNGLGNASDGYLTSVERTALTASLARPASGVLRTPRFLLPVGLTRVQMKIYAYGSQTIRFSRAQIVKV